MIYHNKKLFNMEIILKRLNN